MESHCSCHVRAASYLLLDADVIFLFVSAARSEEEMSRVMDLAKRFEEATAYTLVNLSSLDPKKLYPIVRAKSITTKYGPTVLLSLRVSETSIFQVFLPKRYSDVMSDEDMDNINSKAVSLHLVYK